MQYKNLVQERINTRLDRFKPNDFKKRSLPVTEEQTIVRNVGRLVMVAAVLVIVYAIIISSYAQAAVRS